MPPQALQLSVNKTSAPPQQWPDQSPLQILFWRKVDDITGQLIDLSGDDEDRSTAAQRPMANLLFFTRRDQDDNAEDSYPNLQGYQHNLILFSNDNIFRQWQTEGHSEVLCIRISFDFLKRYLPKHKAFEVFNNQLSQNLPGILSKAHLALTANISAVLNEVLTCTKKGIYRSFYLQAKVIELLVMQFEQYEHYANVSVKQLEQPAHIHKMSLVRDILLADPNTTLSLKELAHKVGTNEFDLKRNFKKMFGNTVFGYLHQHKMERAKQLLLNANNKIATVAELMGYKHATHFTSAFKKYFGYLPNKLKLVMLMPWIEMESITVLIAG